MVDIPYITCDVLAIFVVQVIVADVAFAELFMFEMARLKGFGVGIKDGDGKMDGMIEEIGVAVVTGVGCGVPKAHVGTEVTPGKRTSQLGSEHKLIISILFQVLS